MDHLDNHSLDIQWECKTDMPFEYKFGKIQVGCEGYDYPDDPYVLAGSCGLEYTIDRTTVNSGSSNYQQKSSSYSSNGWNDGNKYESKYPKIYPNLYPEL